ncbi:SAM-dependent methyltransferase [Streptomyces europaeiscabiei]|uniref:SAM-dependent methyltransferase n=1 Tax=Streptomyces europaeiscabiei TaxID=146819 RepID=UPI0029A8C050|nr:SAM-dependent methyltransferase [Streptomyces europaeiscabiei]MDX3619301.1 SAM-dependent methyltransferase [Streptomyces europaeiscabiei]
MTDNPAPSDFPSSSLNRRIVTTRPVAARIWNYWLGGGDYYEVDRKAGDEIRRLHPSIEDYARADRQFLGRAVRHLAADVGIRQFLDIGAGLPTAENTHEVAQHIAPDARIVYVDNDPLVLVHARALLTSSPEGRTDHVDEDLRNVDSVLEHAARTLDLTRPVALMLLDVLAFIHDDENPYGIVRHLMDALPSGSHLVLSHTITSPEWPDVDIAAAWWNEHGIPRLTQRTPEVIAGFFAGLDLLEPGVVSCTRWRPEISGDPASGEPAEVAMYCGVGGKR